MSTTSSAPIIDSKSAKKRKAKATSATPPPAETSAEAKVNGVNHENEGSPYLREIAKQLRNERKRLAAISKTEATVAEFSGTSLDDLIKQKKINQDQRNQVLKKPQIEAHVAQLEEQQRNFQDFAQELEGRHEKDKAALAEEHQAAVEKLKEEAASNSSTASTNKVKESLQIACQFLHAAAFQRQRDDIEENEKQAYEAVLFHLYQGNQTAIDTITNLVEGNDVKVYEPTNGEEIDFTFAKLKISALATPSEISPAEQAAETEVETEPTPAEESPSDPTITNAGLTELEDTAAIPTSTIETSPDDIPSAAPEQASITADAANAQAETSWDPQASVITDATQTGEDWVQVPRDPAETDTGISAEPATQGSTSNWADEVDAHVLEKGTTPVSENDGFSEVRRDRGGRGRGGRGRGYDGRGRGRGGRGGGEFRGRGSRGGRGGPRGAPQAQAS